jgi:hypothetical protein
VTINVTFLRYERDFQRISIDLNGQFIAGPDNPGGNPCRTARTWEVTDLAYPWPGTAGCLRVPVLFQTSLVPLKQPILLTERVQPSGESGYMPR